MVEFKLTIADGKSGKCTQKTISETSAKNLIGQKIGQSIKGELIDLQEYEFMITGGSDKCGFPMRKGIQTPRKRILIEGGVGFKNKRKGMRKRKTVCGETINEKISQINLKITKYGSKPLSEPKEETKKE
jgi:small subunit ribosomal protein S6e